MYTAFYGLREKPFSLTPNPRFLYLAESHREALAHLLYGLEQGEGFIVVSGEVGTGKTTICRTLLERLGAETELAFLFNPSGSGDEMLQSVNEEFGLPAQGLSRRELLSQLNRFLLDKNRESKRVVLIIDEAQNLSTTTLEQVRLLSNLETTSSKLIQIILLGQPELAEKLDSPELRQLRQRIGVRWQLSPLDANETALYVRHRLRVAAGAERGGLFTDAALKEVHRRTGGVPRLVNVLCDRALLAGYAAQSHGIDADLVKQAAQEIRDLRDGAFGRGDVRPAPRRWWFASAAAAAAALALVGGLWIGSGGAGQALRSWLDESGLHEGRADGGALSAAPTDPPSREARSIDASPSASALPAVSAPAPGPAIRPDVLAEGPWPAGWMIDPGAIDDTSADETPSAEDRWAEPGSAAGAAAANGAAGVERGLDAGEAFADDVGDGSFLALLLSQIDPETSRDLAVAEILDAWGLPAASPSSADARDALTPIREAGLAIHALDGSSLEELGLLDYPSLLELRDAEGTAHWVALTELRPSVAFVAGVVDRGAIGVSEEALERQWDGRAYVVWSPEIAVDDDGLLRTGDAGDAVRWVQDALVELGYVAGLAITRPAVYDPVTRRGVERFQRAQGLAQDGVTGPITLMRLDDALGRRDRPRLDRGGAG